ncbi:alpha/beta hydrolase [Verrucomicrobiota bacterium sgz303538]
MRPTPAPLGAETIQTGRHSRRRTFRKLFIRAWLVLASGFLFYLYYLCRASGFPSSVLKTDARVAVTFTSDTITFAPSHRPPDRAALIFVPGAMVEPTAYAPLARSVAERGYTTIIVKLPWRMASFESQRQSIVSRVKDIMESGAPSTKWIVAGHSVGGVLACRVARDHAERLSGLVLIGTSHPRDFDLSHLSLDVTKIAATNDGLASLAEVKANAKHLPSRTRWVVIEGGNHSQFGYYGFQLGDNRATISRSAQQATTVEALLGTLGRASAADGR